MFCTSCGVPRSDDAAVCENCGEPIRRMPTLPRVENYLVQAVLTAFFCCMPVGVIGIIYAAQVNSKLMSGDVAGAQAAAKNAKMWSWIAFGMGLLIAIGYGALLVTQIAGLK